MGGGGGRKDSRQRMPRDVKERMKALPRFIDILKRMPSVTEGTGAAAAVLATNRGGRNGTRNGALSGKVLSR